MNKVVPTEGHHLRSGAPIKVDAVVLSHPDIDHYHGFETLLGNGKIKARCLFLSVPQFFRHAPEFMHKVTKDHGYRHVDTSC